MLFDVDPDDNASDRRSPQQQKSSNHKSGNNYNDSDDAEKELQPQSDNNIEHRTTTATLIEIIDSSNDDRMTLFVDEKNTSHHNPSTQQSSSQLEYLNETLDDLAELWEQRLAEHRKQRQRNRNNIETNIDSQLSTGTTNGNYNNVESVPTTTICAPSQTKTTVDDGGCDHVSVTSSSRGDGALSSTTNNNAVQEGSLSSNTTTNTNNTRVGRNRNQGGLFRNLSSPFASKKVLQEQQQQQQQNDEMIHELECVIRANIDIIRRIKRVIDEIDTPPSSSGDGDNCSSTSSSITNNIAQLKDALSCLGSCDDGGSWGGSFADILLLRTKLADEIECKIMTVRGLEAIINGQEDHQTTLRDEICQLQQVVTTMEIQKSNQEDVIETLKARIVKLELGLQMQDGTIASLQEALDTQAKCNDITIDNLEVEYEKRIHEYKSYYKCEDEQIKMLRARIYELEEERRNGIEELQKEKELASLEQQYI